jgi:hypothetical protein
MTDSTEHGEVDPEERLRDETGVRSEAWKQTNEEMELLAEERRDEGWTVVTIPAVHTSIVTAEMGEGDEFGIEYVIPDNHVEAFTDAFDPEAVTEYQVYRTIANQNVFQVIELLAPEAGTAIMIAGMYELQHAGAFVKRAKAEGELYTFVRTIDGTRHGMLRHDEYEPLLPRPAE